MNDISDRTFGCHESGESDTNRSLRGVFEPLPSPAMKAEFWHERWKKNEIGFHEPKPNPALVKNIARLKLPKRARIFIPLCWKTLDIGWLLSKGFRVAGAELSELAVTQLFEQLRLKPKVVKSKNGAV